MSHLPPSLRWYCALCGEWLPPMSIEENAAHLELHGVTVRRWPDGDVVVDMSGVPELIGGEP